jgi:hypothetical protein
MQKYYTLGPTKSEQTGYLLCYGSIILIFLYMKTIYSTFFTGFLYLWVLGAAGQSTIGASGNDWWRWDAIAQSLVPNQLPTPIATPGFPSHYFYDGRIPKHTQNCQFDEDNNLLFFVIDEYVYDGQGYLIADSYFTNPGAVTSSSLPAIGKQGDLIITARPNHCLQFFIFGTSHFLQGQTPQTVQMMMIDMEVENPLFPGSGRLGKLIGTEEYDDYGLDFNSSGIFNQGFAFSLSIEALGPDKDGNVNFEVVEYPGNTHKTLIISYKSNFGVITMNENTFTLDNVISYSFAGASRPENSEIEVVWNNTLQQYIVALTPPDNLGAFGYEEPMELYYFDAQWNLVSSQEVALSQPVINQHITYGIEFSANGNYLYFTKSTSPEVGYIDVVNLTVEDLTDDFPGIAAFKNTNLEKFENVAGSFDGVLFGTTNGFAALTNCDTPASLVWSTSVAALSGIQPFQHQNQFTTNLLGFNLPNQNYLSTSFLNYLRDADCCVENALNESVPGKVITVSTDGTWTSTQHPFGILTQPIIVLGNLVFESGTNTVIQGMTFEFGPNASVIIEPGASVRLEGSTWTNFHCDQMWPGCDLLGVSSLPQTITNQGRLILQKGSVIENAMIGVQVGTNLQNTGGIVITNDSFFKNNQRDVHMLNYQSVNNLNQPVNNASRFTNTQFITTRRLNNPALIPLDHVFMRRVNVVRFTNCFFGNTSTYDEYDWLQRGTGINAIMASYRVIGNGTAYSPAALNPSSFYRLHRGMVSSNLGNAAATYVMRTMNFEDNLHGLINLGTDFQEITDNSFRIPDAPDEPTLNATERGMYILNSTGYLIANNKLQAFDDAAVSDPFPSGIGIWVENSGPSDNFIQNNSLESLRFGIYVARNNRGADPQLGLQLLCNLFDFNVTDIFRSANSILRDNQGGLSYQNDGSTVDSPAGNMFSAANNVLATIDQDCISQGDFVIHPANTPTNIGNDYFAENLPRALPDCGNDPGEDLDGDGVYGEGEDNDGDLLRVVTFPSEGQFDCSTQLLRMTRKVEDPAYLAFRCDSIRDAYLGIRQHYQTVVDKGNTQALLTIAGLFHPQESEAVRDLLLANLPLSNEVMLGFLERSERMQPVHLTQVLLANAPLSPSIERFLIDRDVLPSTLLQLVLNSQNSYISYKHLLELQMGSYHQALATELMAYKHQLINDTSEVYMLSAFFNLWSQYLPKDEFTMLEMKFWEEMLTAQALEDSTQQPGYTDHFLVAEESMYSVEPILSFPLPTWQSTLDAEKSNLHAMARTFLWLWDSTYTEPEPMPNGFNRSVSSLDVTGKKKMIYPLTLFPNPATVSVALSYPYELDGLGELIMYNGVGQAVYRTPLNKFGLMDIPLSTFQPGLYLVSLLVNDTILSTEKLIVQPQDARP